MSASSTDDADGYATVGVDANDMGRYADVSLEDGEMLIYDRENEDAWIQAEFAIGLEMMI